MKATELQNAKAKTRARDALLTLSGQLLSCSDRVKALAARKGSELEDFTDAINAVENMIRNLNFASLARIAADLEVSRVLAGE